MLTLLSLCLLLTCSDSPFRNSDFEAALAEAKLKDRVVLLSFKIIGVDSYNDMDDSTFQDDELRTWIAKNAIPVRPQEITTIKLLSQLRVRSHPTHFILGASGHEIDRIEGHVDATEFLRIAKDAIAGKGMVHRARSELRGHENDPMERKRFANVLVRAGEFEEALEHYLWCFDAGEEVRPSFCGVRVSYLMGDLEDLLKVYPPTRAELLKRRTPLEQAIRSGDSDYDTLADYAALSRALGEERKTLELFHFMLGLDSTPRATLSGLAREVDERLLADQNYIELYIYAGKTLDSLLGGIKHLESDLADDSSFASRDPDRERISLISHGADVYEVLLGVGKLGEAREAASALLQLRGNKYTYYLLATRAIRTGDVKEARSLRDRGVEALPKRETAWLLRRLRRKLPPQDK